MRQQRNCMILATLFCCWTITGCGPSINRLMIPCAGKDRATVVKDVSAIMASEGLTLTMVNENVGIVQAFTEETGGIFHDGRWQVTLRGDTVQATATMKLQGTTVYCDDDVNEMYQWYWRPRQQLEAYCGAPVIFIEEKK